MKRLYLTVKGQTEAVFASQTLTPHLAAFHVFLNPPSFHRPASPPMSDSQGGLLKLLDMLVQMR